MRGPDSWKRISSKQVADCKVFNVREDVCARNGASDEAKFYVIESPDWVNIIALTPAREVVFAEQYRQGIERVILELPGGVVDPSEGPEETAKREFREETGYTSTRWKRLASSHPNPAIQNNTVHHFLALDCLRTEEASPDRHESIHVKTIPLAEVERALAKGEISDSLIVAAFYYFDKLEVEI